MGTTLMWEVRKDGEPACPGTRFASRNVQVAWGWIAIQRLRLRLKSGGRESGKCECSSKLVSETSNIKSVL